MSVDFKGRTVLKIITENKFEPLMPTGDPKAENLMLSIWAGKEATHCDGNMYGYSNFAYILKSKPKKVQGRQSIFMLMSMITNYFKPNTKVDYQI